MESFCAKTLLWRPWIRKKITNVDTVFASFEVDILTGLFPEEHIEEFFFFAVEMIRCGFEVVQENGESSKLLSFNQTENDGIDEFGVEFGGLDL